MSLKRIRNSFDQRARKLHDVLLPDHPADRLGSKEAAITAIKSVFEDIVLNLGSLTETDFAAARLRRALDSDEDLDLDDVTAVLEAYEAYEEEEEEDVEGESE